MNRRTLVVLGVAALAVFALGLSASALSSEDTPGGQAGPGPGDGEGNPDSAPPADGSEGGVGAAPDTPVLLERLLIVIGALAGIGVLVYLATYRERGAVMVGSVALFMILLWAALTYFDGNVPTNSGEPLELLPGPGNNSTGGGETTQENQNILEQLSGLLMIGLGVVVVGGTLFLVQRRRDGPDDAGVDGEAEDTEVLGEIAGQAADRIEEAESTATGNEVYRAWEEMTEQLDSDTDATTTPREFQAQAVDAGMAADDVRELTRLFETVRYGGKTATDAREERAVDVLRRIESTYGDDR